MRISAEGAFDVNFVAPPYQGAGFFAIINNRVVDFEFSMLGFTWDEYDAGPCECIELNGLLAGINIPFSDAQGGGSLHWNFMDGNFGLLVSAGGIGLAGTSDDGEVGGAFSDFTSSMSVPEPATALLLLAALLCASAGSYLRRR